ncbi:hypothetical protein R1flu_010539 [Riccia fluitans]|uniref:Uncharacterized protein n=1 Tax=Riccia fluitans TaxID=41844 RepID=A0ABD1Z8B0_9MARC
MEGKAITTEIIRGAVKVEGLVAEVCEERKKTIPLRLISHLTTLRKLKVVYFRQFRKLRLLVLSGNPISKDPEYRLFVIAFMRNLFYLDHKLCFKHQIDQAKDEYQDELQELKEKELQEEEDIKSRLAKRAETELYKKANLIGLDGLFDKMLKDDPEHAKLSEVPTLLEGLEEMREKHQTTTAELKGLIIDLYYKEQAEIKLWQSAMTEDVDKKDEESRTLVNKFEEVKKKTIQEAFQDRAFGEEKLKNLLVENDAMQYNLMEIEVVCFDQVQHLWRLFEEAFYSMIDNGKQHFNN